MLFRSLLHAATAAPSPSPSTGGAVGSFDEAIDAVLQIEAVGTFRDPEEGERVESGRGSGFVIDPSGIAVTNNHVVTGAASLKVWLGPDREEHAICWSFDARSAATVTRPRDWYLRLTVHRARGYLRRRRRPVRRRVSGEGS